MAKGDQGAFSRKLLTYCRRVVPKYREGCRAEIQRLLDLGIRGPAGLLRLVTDSGQEQSLRAIACRAYWVLGQRQGWRQLVKVLREDSDSGLVNDIVWALSALKPHGLGRVTIDALKRGRGPHNRLSAASLLGKIRYRAAVPALIRAVRDTSEDVDVRGEAAEALAYIGDRRSSADLIAALSDRRAEVRFWAAFALATVGDDAAIPHLERLVDDTIPIPQFGTVGKEARDAIKAINSRSRARDKAKAAASRARYRKRAAPATLRRRRE
jgi:HEAT repeat protein